MSLIARSVEARDHRGIAKSTDTENPGPDAATGGPGVTSSHQGWEWGGRRQRDRPVAPWVPRRDQRHPPHRHGPWHLRVPLRRDPDARVLGGVCAGISDSTAIDVTIVRIGFALLGLVSGVGVLLYALAWLIVPLGGESSNIFGRAVHDGRGIRLVLAIIPAFIVAQVVASSLHVGFVGSFIWSVFLAAGAAVLIWRNASDDERAWIDRDLIPMVRPDRDRHSPRSVWWRVVLGIVLAIIGILVIALGHNTAAALRPVGGALLFIAAVVVIFGPWWISLVRDLMSERQARALAEERSQMAAHVHDSVLQTLALIQRSADDPQRVRALARTQERELRSWLIDGRPPVTFSDDASTLVEGVTVLQRQVEADHGITVQAVIVGDCPLSDPLALCSMRPTRRPSTPPSGPGRTRYRSMPKSNATR